MWYASRMEPFPIFFGALVTALIAWIVLGAIGVGGAILWVLVAVAFLGSAWLILDKTT